MVSEYYSRTQQVIPVNRNDLEDLVTFDGLQFSAMSLGGFFLSGATWLGAEKLLDQEKFAWTPILALCSVSICFGLLALVAGFVLRNNKRRRLNRILKETSTISADNSPSVPN